MRRPDKPSRSRLRVALYHHISNDMSSFIDDLHVSITPAEFERQLRYFKKNYDIVSLDDVLSGSLPNRPLLITFDDAYRSAFESAAPLLASLHLPALYLISAGHVDGQLLMSDHVLCYLAHNIGLSQVEAAITGAYPTCQTVGELIGKIVSQLDYSRQAGLSAELVSRYSLSADVLNDLRNLYLTSGQVAQLATFGIEVGNHTYSHIYCRHLSAASEELEILQSQRLLESWTNQPVRAFSIPYGDPIDLTPDTNQTLQASGHQVIFTALSRQNHPGQAGLILDRVNMLDCHKLGLWTWFELFPWLRTIRPRRQSQPSQKIRSESKSL